MPTTVPGSDASVPANVVASQARQQPWLGCMAVAGGSARMVLEAMVAWRPCRVVDGAMASYS